MHELNPQYARVMCRLADHPLYAHVRAQKRFGTILRESFSFERQGAGMLCQISSLHSNTKEPSFPYTGTGEESARASTFFFEKIGGIEKKIESCYN